MHELDQAETIAFLASPAAFGRKGAGTGTIVTDVSIVLLLGDRALKLKKAARFAHIDLSTPENRFAACQEELRLNWRAAPSIYRAVHRITREPCGSLVLNGSGPLVDAALDMARFDDSQIFDRLAREELLSMTHLESLGRRIAEFHQNAEIVLCEGVSRIETVLADNARALAATRAVPADDVAKAMQACKVALERHGDLLDRRALSGQVRRCHGDLQLRNICLVDGVPTLFDCLEFDPERATTDVLYDLAFVLMDLWHRRLPLHANILFNRYLDASGDELGTALLPLFMAIHAIIRARAAAAEVAETEFDSAWSRAEARSYLALAHDLLAWRPPLLVAIGGYSGSGKSNVAARISHALGPPPGARILSSDRIRKWLFGVAPETPLGPEAHAAPISDLVHATIAERADALTAAGHAVVVDAVFDRASWRDRLAAIASRGHVSFRGLWLDAPADVLMRRVAARRGDPSDATPDVVMGQIARQSVPADWLCICAICEIEAIGATALLAIREPSVLTHYEACPGRLAMSASPVSLSCSRAVLSAASTRSRGIADMAAAVEMTTANEPPTATRSLRCS
ncbi:AAA family ATPase [Bosea psychrotolerans]|uniref:Uncharacterized protein n=1 Tax=Bosea psychrotolerans TaxID=1871628 RepID=A0A2S4LXN8_9HYPH|nr:AAA family ATPase [Bosea psychrotolerans]POR47148.1 hypothetical protein CYD53_12038 [Bosea psychrotolerans]